MKFRKKPVVVDAVQWFPDRKIDGVEPVYERGDSRPCAHGIRTLEGFMYVSPGDWIITGVKGEKYPCKLDIFERTYEPTEAT